MLGRAQDGIIARIRGHNWQQEADHIFHHKCGGLTRDHFVGPPVFHRNTDILLAARILNIQTCSLWIL